MNYRMYVLPLFLLVILLLEIVSSGKPKRRSTSKDGKGGCICRKKASMEGNSSYSLLRTKMNFQKYLVLFGLGRYVLPVRMLSGNVEK